MSKSNTTRDAHVQVLKGLRGLLSYIDALEDIVLEDRDDLDFLYVNEGFTQESVDLGIEAIYHSIKGLTNEVNK